MIQWTQSCLIIDQLEKMHVSVSSPWSRQLFQMGAPYKPLMILAVTDGVNERVFESCREIVLNNWLVGRYEHYLGVCGDSVRNTPRIPFIHLRNEPFWRLISKLPHIELRDNKELRVEHIFDAYVAGAEINSTLFAMMRDQQWRGIIRYSIIKTYFTDYLANRLWNV